MAYPTQEGIGEVAVGSGMAGIHFMLAVPMELLKDYEEASRTWMSEVKLWSKLAVKLYRQAPPVRIGGPAHGLNVAFLFAMIGSRNVLKAHHSKAIQKRGQTNEQRNAGRESERLAEPSIKKFDERN